MTTPRRSLRVDDEEWALWSRAAKDRGKTITDLIRAAMAAFIQELPVEEPEPVMTVEPEVEEEGVWEPPEYQEPEPKAVEVEEDIEVEPPARLVHRAVRDGAELVLVTEVEADDDCPEPKPGESRTEFLRRVTEAAKAKARAARDRMKSGPAYDPETGEVFEGEGQAHVVQPPVEKTPCPECNRFIEEHTGKEIGACRDVAGAMGRQARWNQALEQARAKAAKPEPEEELPF